MPAKTTEKGEIGEAMVIADLMRQGHEVAIPFGHNQPYDLIVIRKEDGRLEKVQVKYTSGNGRFVKAKWRARRPGFGTDIPPTRSIGSPYMTPRPASVSISIQMYGQAKPR